MMKKKLSIAKTFALAVLLCSLVFGATSFALNAAAAEKNVTSITIEIDYGDYDGSALPKGKTGKTYPVFAYSALDNEKNGVNDVRITVKDPNKQIVPQKNGRFKTDVAGDYTIEYTAVSGIISETKIVKISVENYTDTLVYNAKGESVPAAVQSGETVFADFGTFSGGVGDLSFDFAVKFGETDISYSATESGIYFVPEKSGEYKVAYSVVDFVADEKSVEKTIIVTDSEIPVMQKPSLPASAISGETLDLPLPDGVLYKDGEKYYLPVGVYFDNALVGSDMRVSDLKAGAHTIKYVCVNPVDESKKVEYSFNLTVKEISNEKGKRLFDNYFDFSNCSPFTGDKKAYSVKVNKTESASFAFSREIPVDYLNFDISTTASASAYSDIYFVLTDAKNVADCIKVKIRKLSTYENLWISYDDKTKTVINSESGEILEEIKSYSDGRTFEGFKSGKAYISFEINDVKKEADFTLRKIASNVITTDSVDYGSPTFLPNNDFRSVYVSYIGHSVYLPELKAFDLFDKDVDVTLTVYDEEGTVFSGKGDYTLNITKSGEFMVKYVASDSNGNQKPQVATIYVTDLVSPVIKVADIKSTVKVGEEIVLPKAEITDNDTPSDEITSYVYVVKGNYQKKLIGETYRFEETGEYKIRYAAYDNNQNYTVVEFTVYCK